MSKQIEELRIGKYKYNGCKESAIADPYSVSKAYSKGDLVMNNGYLYSALEDMEAGDWDAEKWLKTNVGNTIPTTTSELTNNSGFITESDVTNISFDSTMNVTETSSGLVVGCKSQGGGGSSEKSGYVRIGQHFYKTCVVGSRKWTEPIFEDNGCIMSATVAYYKSDMATINQGYGCIYFSSGLVNSDYSLVRGFNSIVPDGWRLPTIADVLELFKVIDPTLVAIPNVQIDATKLISQSLGGTDDFGFGINGGGLYMNGYYFLGTNDFIFVNGKNPNDNSSVFSMIQTDISPNKLLGLTTYASNIQCSVRLVSDV